MRIFLQEVDTYLGRALLEEFRRERRASEVGLALELLEEQEMFLEIDHQEGVWDTPAGGEPPSPKGGAGSARNKAAPKRVLTKTKTQQFAVSKMWPASTASLINKLLTEREEQTAEYLYHRVFGSLRVFQVRLLLVWILLVFACKLQLLHSVLHKSGSDILQHDYLAVVVRSRLCGSETRTCRSTREERSLVKHPQIGSKSGLRGIHRLVHLETEINKQKYAETLLSCKLAVFHLLPGCENFEELDFAIETLRRAEAPIVVVLMSSLFVWGMGTGLTEEDYEKREPQIPLFRRWKDYENRVLGLNDSNEFVMARVVGCGAYYGAGDNDKQGFFAHLFKDCWLGEQIPGLKIPEMQRKHSCPTVHVADAAKCVKKVAEELMTESLEVGTGRRRGNWKTFGTHVRGTRIWGWGAPGWRWYYRQEVAGSRRVLLFDTTVTMLL